MQQLEIVRLEIRRLETVAFMGAL